MLRSTCVGELIVHTTEFEKWPNMWSGLLTVCTLLFVCRGCVCAVNGNESQAEVQLLLEFKDSLIDSKGVLANWNPKVSSACNWTGISCDNRTVAVVSISLSNYSLEGTISSALGGLRHLQHIDLGFNALTGSIPGSLANCSSLDYFSVQANQLTGEIPPEFGRLQNLQTLDLYHNTLTGQIPLSLLNCSQLIVLALGMNNLEGRVPAQIGKLVHLQQLILEYNNFSGSIPKSLANCSELFYLSLQENRISGDVPGELGLLKNLQILFLYVEGADLGLLSGSIPPELGLLPRIQLIVFSGNKFSGKIPVSLSNCSTLIQLDLAVNNLVGEIPPELGMLPNLQQISLWRNGLTGRIPESISNCTFLTDNLLSDNLLTGTIPTSVMNMSQLEYFIVDGNKLQGRIPDVFGFLTSLGRLGVQANNFTGRIPPSLGNCTSLTNLALAANRFSGSIPSSLGNLVNLTILRLSTNQLSGSIPIELMRCTKLVQLDLYNNQLSSTIPAEIGGLSSLVKLRLQNNRLTGGIPNTLFSCSRLQYLSLAQNNLSGEIYGNGVANISSHIVTFDLSQNRLSGSLPLEIGQLEVIQTLDLSFNNLSGQIPANLDSCLQLTNFNLSSNNLQGGIPVALSNLPLLASLNLSYNNLEGPIPNSGVFLGITIASLLGNNQLCGEILNRTCPALSPSQSPFPSGFPIRSSHESSCPGVRCIWIWVAVTVLVVILTIAAVAILTWCCRTSSGKQIEGLWGPDQGLVILSAEELIAATDGFSPDNILGASSASTVYKAVLFDGLVVAVKLLQVENSHLSSENDLLREAKTMQSLRHRNLLKSLGLGSTGTSRALILEFMENGSLHKQLHEVGTCLLDWKLRLDIAEGVAQAMLYLHEDYHEPIIHRDLKPSNILLDSNFVPKVADFGIAKFVRHPRGIGDASTSKFRGTPGYAAPEYATSNNVTTRGDVYSYGVVLLELMTGKQPTDSEAFGQGNTLVTWVFDAFERPIDVVDKRLSNDLELYKEQMVLLMRVGLHCTSHQPQKRPSMRQALEMLVQIKELQEKR